MSSKRTRGTPRQIHRSEFSSDEEFVRRSPRFGGRKQMTKTASQMTYIDQVVQLSDEDLMEELKSYGEDPGPILPTTRGIYQKKLAKLMAERTKASSHMRREEVVDYAAADQMGEWSSHSSEGEGAEETHDQLDEDEEEEEEEEAGVLIAADEEEEEVVVVPTRRRPVRQAHTAADSTSKSKGRKVAYVSYSTPTRHVESSYLLNKPGAPGSSSKAQKLPTTQRSAKPRPSKQSPLPSTSRPPPPASPPRPIQSKSTTSSTSSSDWWSSLLGVALLIVMFAVTFLVYDHYTSPDNSFVSQGFDYLKQHGIFKPQE